LAYLKIQRPSVTRSVSEFELREEVGQIYTEFENLGFSKHTYRKSSITRIQSPNFDKISVINATREKIAVNFQVLENTKNSKKYHQILRILDISEFDNELLFNIELIRKNPRYDYLGYTMKEYYDLERINKILLAHFYSE